MRLFILALASLSAFGVSAGAQVSGGVKGNRPVILDPSTFKSFIDRFNAEDTAGTGTIPNSGAWEFLAGNIPWFDCPDAQLMETYYYRWWSFRKHLTETPAGWVITEFLPKVSWAGIYNTISCAAGHHLYEARWLRDPRYATNYAEFWQYPEAQPRNYSFWLADSTRAVALATGNERFAQRMLPNLVANYRAWEKTNEDPNGLFHQVDDRDGMEYSLGGSGYRPSINSYMFGDASAIAEIAERSGEKGLASEFREKAAGIKREVQQHLWNPSDKFFETAPRGDGGELLPPCGTREEIGFVPWYFNLPNAGYAKAWKQLLDPRGFAAPFGPTTVERRARGFMHPENHDCLWNGPSWPYATTQTLVAMANLLDNSAQSVVSKDDYFKQLLGYSRSQQKGGRPWIAEDLNADTGAWIVDESRSVCYNHSGFADLIVTGLVGIRPRADDKLVVKPLVPAGAWPWFCLDSVPYHGQSVTVLWDVDGKHYGRGAGLRIFVNGREAAHSGELEELSVVIPSAPKEYKPLASSARWTKYGGGPVLGGALGTCFDICVLQDGGKYRMYFSWRPKQSIACVESTDGIHWDKPKIVLGPANTGWEDDLNRPSVIFHDGKYLMWYTGQFKGQSSIGFAQSEGGFTWKRMDKPVFIAEQPWEKEAVMCPSVIWDEGLHAYRMWFSGGEQYEPDAIGYATSTDGVHWKKNDGPIFEADPANRWEQYKVTACQVLERQGWFYMFYLGFRDIDHSQIGIARSRDGISHWERMKDNPIISPTVDGWDADACYKPFALYDEKSKRWLLWYNGRRGGSEQIGVCTKPRLELGFE